MTNASIHPGFGRRTPDVVYAIRDLDGRIPRRQYQVLSQAAQIAQNNGGIFWLSVPTLARMAQVSDRTVQRTLAWAVDQHIIEVLPDEVLPDEIKAMKSEARRIRHPNDWRQLPRKRRAAGVTKREIVTIPGPVTKRAQGSCYSKDLAPNIATSSSSQREETSSLPSHRRPSGSGGARPPRGFQALEPLPRPKRVRKRPDSEQLAIYFKIQAKGRTQHPEPVNQKLLASKFAGWLQNGLAYEDIRTMIDKYWAPGFPRKADAVPWVDFCAARAALLDRARHSTSGTDMESLRGDRDAWM